MFISSRSIYLIFDYYRKYFIRIGVNKSHQIRILSIDPSCFEIVSYRCNSCFCFDRNIMVMVIVVRRLIAAEVIHQIIHQHLVVNILIIQNLLNRQNINRTDIMTYEMGKYINKYFIEITTVFCFLDIRNLCLKNLIINYFHSDIVLVVDQMNAMKNGIQNTNKSNTSLMSK